MFLDFAIALLSAAQASLSVLLTIGVGVAAAQFGFLDGDTSRRISRLSVDVFLPLLLASNIGSELNLDTAFRYLPILTWAVLYAFLTLTICRAAVILFRLPKWTVAAVTFNNTTSLPLLLVQSLKSTSVLEGLLGSDPDFDRIRSYFLVFAVVINVLTFGEGERALTGYKEHAFPFAALLGLRKYAVDYFDTGVRRHGDGGSENVAWGVRRESEGLRGDSDSEISGAALEDGDLEDGPTQTTPLLQRRISPLLPSRLTRRPASISRRICTAASRTWDRLPGPFQRFFHPFRPFVNSPSLGALAGVVIGLTPPLHRLFFNPMHQGGYFNAWLTTPMKNIGDLFVTLQVIVVGVSLGLSLRQRRKDKKTGEVPRRALMFVILMRFVILPAISIPVIWSLASSTNLLTSDPALWFTMMLMPVGPPAMKLLALADVNDVDEEITMSIARLLTISYAVTPLISLPVVGALRASESVGK